MKKWLPWAIGAGVLAWFFLSGKKQHRFQYAPGQALTLSAKVGDSVVFSWPALPGGDSIDFGITGGNDLGDPETAQHGGTEQGPGLWAFNIMLPGTMKIEIVSGNPDTHEVHGKMILTIVATK